MFDDRSTEDAPEVATAHPPNPEAQAELTALRTQPLTVVGRLLAASNIAVLARLGDGPRHVVYKPVVGERPLWDFPDGHLAYREVAASAICAAGGWDVIPPTVLRDGPLGPGSVQAWVTPVPDAATAAIARSEAEPEHPLGVAIDEQEEHGDAVVRLFAPDAVPSGWLPAFAGELSNGAPVVVAHADTPRIASLAVLDAVLNNSDRKGSHLLEDERQVVWGIDHGVTLHEDDKLRTVLWGWAGDPLPPAELERLARLHDALAEREEGEPQDGGLVAVLEHLLTEPELTALHERVQRLRRSGRFPHPSPDWPAIPWPPL